jgi:endo-1,4-beta-xylanase
VTGLRRIGPVALAAALATVTVLTVAGPAGAAGGLGGLAEAKGRYFGTELTAGDLNVGAETALAAAQFDMVTPGNEMKWDTVEPSRGSFNFAPGDRIVSFAQSHGMRVRGHNLVWHAQLPGWVSALPTNQVQAAMEAHITAEATHYKGKLYAWDVVNEPFNEDGSLRTDAFTRAMGSGYIADALRTAHAADPAARLYLNDYNIEGTGAKSNAMYALAQSLLAQGVPLNGIGFESHFVVGQLPSSLLSNLQRFAALGLDVAITELDDRIPLPASSSALQQQGADYRTVVTDCLAVSRCVGVSQWGVDDGHSWIPGTFPGYGAATMYDSNYQPKPAYTASAAALGGTGGGTGTGPVRAVGAGRCLDVAGQSTTAGAAVQVWDCSGAANQTWTRTSTNQLTVYTGGSQLCLDAYAKGTTPGTRVVTWTCNGGTNQQWTVNSDGTIRSVLSGLCLDVTGAATANGTLVELWTCTGAANQRWTLG